MSFQINEQRASEQRRKQKRAASQLEDLQLTRRTAVEDKSRRYPMSVYESPFPANHLPLKPTFNSSNPFLNSTDHLEPSGSRSYTTGRSDSTSFGGDASDSSQPHPLKRSRGIKRGLDEVEQHVDTDDLPDKVGDEDPCSIPPPRRSAKRLMDISHRIADYGQPEPSAATKAAHPEVEQAEANPGGDVEVEVGDEVGDIGEAEIDGEEQDVDGEGEFEEEEEEDDDEDSELSEEFDATPFDHECKPEVADISFHEIDPNDKSAPGNILRGIPSSDLYDEHMQVRTFDERLDVKADIRKINEAIEGMKQSYRIVDRLGEGTFSSVYKAIDIDAFTYENDFWRKTIHVAHSRNLQTYIPKIDVDGDGHGETDEPAATDLNKEDQAWTDKGEPRRNYVALKRIYVTSSPDRIVNELEIMEELRGCRNTAQLISAFRSEDQIVAVMPYHRSDDFRLYYKYIDPPHIRKYFRCLFRALNDTHNRGIIHRDVKPANFLWDYESGEGVLVDFGLAERYETPSKIQCQHSPATLERLHGERIKTNMTARVEQAVYDVRKREASGRVGIPQVDNRPGVRANRAGTRGFRAPEVLLKCPDQTFAIDIWAVGIILLSVLCHRFPVFNSNDDTEALLELGAIFGRSGLEKAAMLHNRTFATNLNTVPLNPTKTLSEMVLSLNPTLYNPPCSNPTPAEAKRHIESVDNMLDLLKRCLVIDSTRRWTAGMLLRHKFLEEGLRDDEKEDGGFEQGELRGIAEGVCGHMHFVRNGQHWAVINGSEYLCGWGQGRAYGETECYLHKPENQRPVIWDDEVESVR
ncbi:kinase-like domain-containing protein [Filobasidium floriforme]|uniref:kinase-like domain-containing protein n=1 Tax=Filobasidium floriforme TaxID=5210 RepID=UPI001E8CEF4A|nr:kinase-like domain-containing protein [Filobasidium floriforme]KAH8083700.1 kinase-like domain-containing protein [Filobasidium floriforme]